MVDNTKEEKYRDWDICEECGLNGDDTWEDENGNQVSNCPYCPYNGKDPWMQGGENGKCVTDNYCIGTAGYIL